MDLLTRRLTMRTRSQFTFCLGASALLLFGSIVGCEKMNMPKSLDDLGSTFEGAYSVPDPAIDAIGTGFYESWKKAAELNKTLNTDPELVEAVNIVFNNLVETAKHSEKYGETAKQFEWEINVITDHENNTATAWPGGKVFYYTGARKQGLTVDKAQLAALLGHEMIHALERHAGQRIKRNVVAALPMAGIATGAALDPKSLSPEVVAPILGALGVGYAGGVDLPFARENESEADKEGFLLSTEAGYNPDKSVKLYENLYNSAKDTEANEYLSSHPMSQDRLAEVQNVVMKDAKQNWANVTKKQGKRKAPRSHIEDHTNVYVLCKTLYASWVIT